MITFNLRTTALAVTLSAINVFATACDAEPADEPFAADDETAEFRVVSHDNGYMMNGYMMNGYMMNGYMMNGYMMNGYMMNGYMMNGYMMKYTRGSTTPTAR